MGPWTQGRRVPAALVVAGVLVLSLVIFSSPAVSGTADFELESRERHATTGHRVRRDALV
jgi:hypothetical protein